MEPMFDIYITQTDGTPLLIESVECLAIARDTAYHLSMLFPGESFVYCERLETSFSSSLIGKLGGPLEATADTHASLRLPC